MKSLSLIVPAHNSAKFIKSSLRDYYKAFSEKYSLFELIVVCNACTDNTFEVCNSLKAEFPITVIHIPNRGKGSALKKGFSYARYEIVGFLDADNPYDLNEIVKMFDYFSEYDMVIVTKFKTISKYQTSITRRFFSIAGAVIFRILFGYSFKDTQAGAKFMKKELLDKIKNDFICEGFEFDMELLYKMSKINARIREYYIPQKESDFSTIKARVLPGIIYRLLKLRLSK